MDDRSGHFDEKLFKNIYRQARKTGFNHHQAEDFASEGVFKTFGLGWKPDAKSLVGHFTSKNNGRTAAQKRFVNGARSADRILQSRAEASGFKGAAIEMLGEEQKEKPFRERVRVSGFTEKQLMILSLRTAGWRLQEIRDQLFPTDSEWDSFYQALMRQVVHLAKRPDGLIDESWIEALQPRKASPRALQAEETRLRTAEVKSARESKRTELLKSLHGGRKNPLQLFQESPSSLKDPDE